MLRGIPPVKGNNTRTHAQKFHAGSESSSCRNNRLKPLWCLTSGFLFGPIFQEGFELSSCSSNHSSLSGRDVGPGFVFHFWRSPWTKARGVSIFRNKRAPSVFAGGTRSGTKLSNCQLWPSGRPVPRPFGRPWSGSPETGATGGMNPRPKTNLEARDSCLFSLKTVPFFPNAEEGEMHIFE